MDNGDDDVSDTSPETADPAPSTNNNKETEDRQSGKTKKKKNSSKNSGPELATEDVTPIEVQTSKRKDSTELETQVNQTKKSPLPPVVASNVNVDDSLQLSNRGNKRKKENVPTDTLIISKSTTGQYRNGTTTSNESSSNVLDTQKEMISLTSTLKSLSPTSVTSPKKPIKREEGWKEVVRRGPVSSRENSSSNLGTAAGAAKKSQSSDRASATLSIIQSSERSKKVTVPSNAISRVIGRAGCNINAIREISGAHIEIEKQGKGQGDRTVLIKGMAESIRQAQQLISALIKEPEKEFNELMTKFRAANAAAKAGGTAVPTQATTGLTKTASGTTTTGSVLQPKVTRAATTIASSKPSQSAPISGVLAPVPSTVAWGAINTLIVAASSPKRVVPVSGTKTPPVTSVTLQQQQQQPKSGAVRQLFPDNSPTPVPVKRTTAQLLSSAVTASTSKPSVSYTLAGNTTVAPTTNAVSMRTTPVVSASNTMPTRPTPQQLTPVVSGSKTSAVEIGKKPSPPTAPSPSFNMNPMAPTSQSQPGLPPSVSMSATSVAGMNALTSRPSSTSPVQDYSPFNNPFSKVAGASMWAKEQQKSKNFASVAASGVNPPGKVPSPVTSQSDTSGPSVNVVDAAKAPGYRGNLNAATAQSSHNLNSISESMSVMEVPTSLASSAPGTPIPSSGPIRAPVGSRLHPLTPPPRMGSPPLFNPTPIQPSGPIGNRHLPPPPQQQNIPTSGMEGIMVPPPSTASLAPGGPSAVRMRTRMQPHEQTQQHPPQFDGLSMPNFYGMAPPATGPMERPGQAFPLAPGMGGPPRYVYYLNLYLFFL